MIGEQADGFKAHEVSHCAASDGRRDLLPFHNFRRGDEVETDDDELAGGNSSSKSRGYAPILRRKFARKSVRAGTAWHPQQSPLPSYRLATLCRRSNMVMKSSTSSW